MTVAADTTTPPARRSPSGRRLGDLLAGPDGRPLLERADQFTPKGQALLNYELPDNMSPAQRTAILRFTAEKIGNFTLEARTQRRRAAFARDVADEGGPMSPPDPLAGRSTAERAIVQGAAHLAGTLPEPIQRAGQWIANRIIPTDKPIKKSTTELLGEPQGPIETGAAMTGGMAGAVAQIALLRRLPFLKGVPGGSVAANAGRAGAAVGLLSAMQPAEDLSSRAIHTGIGAVAGGVAEVIPAAVAAGGSRVASAVLRPETVGTAKQALSAVESAQIATTPEEVAAANRLLEAAAGRATQLGVKQAGAASAVRTAATVAGHVGAAGAFGPMSTYGEYWAMKATGHDVQFPDATDVAVNTAMLLGAGFAGGAAGEVLGARRGRPPAGAVVPRGPEAPPPSGATVVEGGPAPRPTPEAIWQFPGRDTEAAAKSPEWDAARPAVLSMRSNASAAFGAKPLAIFGGLTPEQAFNRAFNQNVLAAATEAGVSPEALPKDAIAKAGAQAYKQVAGQHLVEQTMTLPPIPAGDPDGTRKLLWRKAATDKANALMAGRQVTMSLPDPADPKKMVDGPATIVRVEMDPSMKQAAVRVLVRDDASNRLIPLAFDNVQALAGTLRFAPQPSAGGVQGALTTSRLAVRPEGPTAPEVPPAGAAWVSQKPSAVPGREGQALAAAATSGGRVPAAPAQLTESAESLQEPEAAWSAGQSLVERLAPYTEALRRPNAHPEKRAGAAALLREAETHGIRITRRELGEMRARAREGAASVPEENRERYVADRFSAMLTRRVQNGLEGRVRALGRQQREREEAEAAARAEAAKRPAPPPAPPKPPPPPTGGAPAALPPRGPAPTPPPAGARPATTPTPAGTTAPAAPAGGQVTHYPSASRGGNIPIREMQDDHLRNAEAKQPAGPIKEALRAERQRRGLAPKETASAAPAVSRPAPGAVGAAQGAVQPTAAGGAAPSPRAARKGEGEKHPPRSTGEGTRILSYDLMPPLDPVHEMHEAELADIHAGFDKLAADAGAPGGIRLMVHQRENVSRILAAWARGDAMLIGDGTGLGKTITALAALHAARARGTAKSFVVVAPNQTVIRQWAETGAAFGFKDALLSSTGPATADPGTINYVTYATMRLRGGDLGITPDAIVLDEAHKIGNWSPSAKDAAQPESAAVMKALRAAKHRLFLSATPMQTALNYAYLSPFMPSAYANFGAMLSELGIQYNADENKWEGLSQNKLLKLHQRLVESGVYSKTEMEVTDIRNRWGEQVQMYVDPVYAPITAAMAKKYNVAVAVIQQAIRDVRNGTVTIEGANPRVLQAQRTAVLRAIVEEGRVDFAVKLALRKHAEGFSPVVFVERLEGSDFATKKTESEIVEFLWRRLAQAGVKHESPVQMVRRALEKAGLKTVEISGNVAAGSTARETGIRAFNSGDADAAVVTIAAGGTGLSLHDMRGDRPRFGIMVQTPFKAATGTQAIGRIFRLGSQSDAQFIVLASMTPTDKRYVEKLMRRFAIMGTIVKGAAADVGESHAPVEFEFPDQEDMPETIEPGGGSSHEDLEQAMQRVRFDREKALARMRAPEPEDVPPPIEEAPAPPAAEPEPAPATPEPERAAERAAEAGPVAGEPQEPPAAPAAPAAPPVPAPVTALAVGAKVIHSGTWEVGTIAEIVGKKALVEFEGGEKRKVALDKLQAVPSAAPAAKPEVAASNVGRGQKVKEALAGAPPEPPTTNRPSWQEDEGSDAKRSQLQEVVQEQMLRLDLITRAKDILAEAADGKPVYGENGRKPLTAKQLEAIRQGLEHEEQLYTATYNEVEMTYGAEEAERLRRYVESAEARLDEGSPYAPIEARVAEAKRAHTAAKQAHREMLAKEHKGEVQAGASAHTEVEVNAAEAALVNARAEALLPFRGKELAISDQITATHRVLDDPKLDKELARAIARRVEALMETRRGKTFLAALEGLEERAWAHFGKKGELERYRAARYAEPAAEEPSQGEPARAADPKPGEEIRQWVVEKVWRTATAKEVDGLLHVTAVNVEGYRTTFVGKEWEKFLSRDSQSFEPGAGQLEVTGPGSYTVMSRTMGELGKRYVVRSARGELPGNYATLLEASAEAKKLFEAAERRKSAGKQGVLPGTPPPVVGQQPSAPPSPEGERAVGALGGEARTFDSWFEQLVGERLAPAQAVLEATRLSGEKPPEDFDAERAARAIARKALEREGQGDLFGGAPLLGREGLIGSAGAPEGAEAPVEVRPDLTSSDVGGGGVTDLTVAPAEIRTHPRFQNRDTAGEQGGEPASLEKLVNQENVQTLLDAEGGYSPDQIKMNPPVVWRDVHGELGPAGGLWLLSGHHRLYLASNTFAKSPETGRWAVTGPRNEPIPVKVMGGSLEYAERVAQLSNRSGIGNTHSELARLAYAATGRGEKPADVAKQLRLRSATDVERLANFYRIDADLRSQWFPPGAEAVTLDPKYASSIGAYVARWPKVFTKLVQEQLLKDVVKRGLSLADLESHIRSWKAEVVDKLPQEVADQLLTEGRAGIMPSDWARAAGGLVQHLDDGLARAHDTMVGVLKQYMPEDKLPKKLTRAAVTELVAAHGSTLPKPARAVLRDIAEKMGKLERVKREVQKRTAPVLQEAVEGKNVADRLADIAKYVWEELGALASRAPLGGGFGSLQPVVDWFSSRAGEAAAGALERYARGLGAKARTVRVRTPDGQVRAKYTEETSGFDPASEWGMYRNARTSPGSWMGDFMTMPPRLRSVALESRATMDSDTQMFEEQLWQAVGRDFVQTVKQFHGDAALAHAAMETLDPPAADAPAEDFAEYKRLNTPVVQAFRKKWEPSLRAARKWYDELYALVKQVCERNGVKPPRYRKNYISHIIAGDIEWGMDDLARFFLDRDIGIEETRQIARRFANQREGDQNYVKDFWVATQAYARWASAYTARVPLLAEGKKLLSGEWGKADPQAAQRVREAVIRWAIPSESVFSKMMNDTTRAIMFARLGGGVSPIRAQEAMRFARVNAEQLAALAIDGEALNRFVWAGKGVEPHFTQPAAWRKVGDTASGGTVWGGIAGHAYGAGGAELHPLVQRALDNTHILRVKLDQALGRKVVAEDELAEMLRQRNAVKRFAYQPGTAIVSWIGHRIAAAGVGLSVATQVRNMSGLLTHVLTLYGARSFVAGLGRFGRVAQRSAARGLAEYLHHHGMLSDASRKRMLEALPYTGEDLLVEAGQFKQGWSQDLGQYLERLEAGAHEVDVKAMRWMMHWMVPVEAVIRGISVMAAVDYHLRKGTPDDILAREVQAELVARNNFIRDLRGSFREPGSLLNRVAETEYFANFLYDRMGQASPMADAWYKTFVGMFSTFPWSTFMHREVGGLTGVAHVARAAIGQMTGLKWNRKPLRGSKQGYSYDVPPLGSREPHGPPPAGSMADWLRKGGATYLDRLMAEQFGRWILVTGALATAGLVTGVNFLTAAAPFFGLLVLGILKALYPDNETIGKVMKQYEAGVVLRATHGSMIGGGPVGSTFMQKVQGDTWGATVKGAGDFAYDMAVRTAVSLYYRPLRGTLEVWPEIFDTDGLRWAYDAMGMKTALFDLTPQQKAQHILGFPDLDPKVLQEHRKPIHPRPHRSSFGPPEMGGMSVPAGVSAP